MNCPRCFEENKVKTNLGSIKDLPFDFEAYPKGENSFSFKLPHSGVSVTYKILNQKDERDMEIELTQMKKISPEISREITTRLKYLITSVNGNGDKAQGERI